MPCVLVKMPWDRYPAIVNLAPPSEFVTMANGKRLELEWHDYFGPGAVTRTGVRLLTSPEFQDPNVDAWMVKHGCKSIAEQELTDAIGVVARELVKAREKVTHKINKVDQHGNGSALCFKRPRPINLKTETGVISDDSLVTCKKCRRILDGGKP